MLVAAGLPDGQWQIQRLLPRPLVSTTPDVTFDDPDDDEVKVFIYLDGLSGHLHGNPETRDRDMQIRGQLRSEGHTVIEITAHDLDDEQQMVKHFRKLARILVGRKTARNVAASADGWFRGEQGAEPSEAPATGPPLMLELPFYPTLKIACGAFAAGQAEHESEVITVPQSRVGLDPNRYFVVRAEGDSMDAGNAPIRDGDLVLLERQDAAHAGSVSGYGRPWAVEYRDEAGNAAYVLKHVKKDADGAYRLVSNNPAYPDIVVDPARFFPVARFVETLPVASESPGMPDGGN